METDEIVALDKERMDLIMNRENLNLFKQISEKAGLNANISNFNVFMENVLTEKLKKLN